MPRVLRGPPALHPQAVYVGRPSKWGNKHVAGWCARCRCHHTRSAAIAMYAVDLEASPELLAALPELTGRDLVCWCAPLRCHADVLLRRANPVL